MRCYALPKQFTGRIIILCSSSLPAVSRLCNQWHQVLLCGSEGVAQELQLSDIPYICSITNTRFVASKPHKRKGAEKGARHTSYGKFRGKDHQKQYDRMRQGHVTCEADASVCLSGVAPWFVSAYHGE